MNLRGFLKQEITVQRMQGMNAYQEIAYSSPETLPARVEEKQNVVRSPQGAETLATTRVMTISELAVGDLVNGQAVQARESIVDVAGKTLGWTVYL